MTKQTIKEKILEQLKNVEFINGLGKYPYHKLYPDDEVEKAIDLTIQEKDKEFSNKVEQLKKYFDLEAYYGLETKSIFNLLKD